MFNERPQRLDCFLADGRARLLYAVTSVEGVVNHSEQVCAGRRQVRNTYFCPTNYTPLDASDALWGNCVRSF